MVFHSGRFKRKEFGMREPITWKTYAMAVIALAVFALAIALQGGKFGPSDLELYRMAAEPWR